MTCIDRLKFAQFASNRDGHFKNARIVNFDIIHLQCRWMPLENSEEYYRAIKQCVLTKAVRVTFRNSIRFDLWIQRDLIVKDFSKK